LTHLQTFGDFVSSELLIQQIKNYQQLPIYHYEVNIDNLLNHLESSLSKELAKTLAFSTAAATGTGTGAAYDNHQKEQLRKEIAQGKRPQVEDTQVEGMIFQKKNIYRK
jgi:hypothetical protein